MGTKRREVDTHTKQKFFVLFLLSRTPSMRQFLSVLTIAIFTPLSCLLWRLMSTFSLSFHTSLTRMKKNNSFCIVRFQGWRRIAVEYSCNKDWIGNRREIGQGKQKKKGVSFDEDLSFSFCKCFDLFLTLHRQKVGKGGVSVVCFLFVAVQAPCTFVCPLFFFFLFFSTHCRLFSFVFYYRERVKPWQKVKYNL